MRDPRRFENVPKPPAILFSQEDFKSVQAVEKMLSELLDESPFFDPREKDALTNHRRGQLEEAVRIAQDATFRLVTLLTVGGMAEFVEINVDEIERQRANAGRKDA